MNSKQRETWLAERRNRIGDRCKYGCGKVSRHDSGFARDHAKYGMVDGTLSRFMKFVEKTENCWLWIGATGEWGYGHFNDGGKTRTASRVAYELFVGPIAAGLCVLHRCDNPACVNPGHLFLGNNADNRSDCVAKGRAHGAEGEANCKAKLNRSYVAEIRSLRRMGISTKKLAEQFCVNRTTIQRVVSGRIWK